MKRGEEKKVEEKKLSERRLEKIEVEEKGVKVIRVVESRKNMR